MVNVDRWGECLSV